MKRVTLVGICLVIISWMMLIVSLTAKLMDSIQLISLILLILSIILEFVGIVLIIND